MSSYSGFWGGWSRIYGHIYKIQYGGFKMVNDILEKYCRFTLNFSQSGNSILFQG